MENRKTFPSIRGTSPEITRRAQYLRQSMTPAEATLWDSIRNKKLQGLRFRASHPVGRFILDFYCPAIKLVIELDGAHHASQQERDQERSAQLAAFGYHVLRFNNDDVLSNLSKVLEAIAAEASSLRGGD